MNNRIIESRPAQRSFAPRFNLYVALPLLLATGFVLWMAYRFIDWMTAHLGTFWSAHWGVIVTVGAVTALGVFAKPIWMAFKALSSHRQELKDREVDRELKRATTQLLQASTERGFHTEILNSRTGDMLKVTNPYLEGALRTRVQEISPAQGQKLLSSPGLAMEYPDPQDFAEVLKFWRPSDEAIYLIDTVNGPITVPHNKTFHTALAGPTGAGKTNMFRLLLAQSLYCGADVVIANPNYAPIKMNGSSVEDWRPIAAMLKTPVARRIEDIMQVIDDAIAELDERRERQQRDPRPFVEKHYAFGEWPAIVSMLLSIFGKKIADAYTMKYGRLLRESRQYNYHVISEFQDALIQTIGGNSGVRENYRTAIYAGGDPITAKALLDLRSGEPLPDETGLGQMGGVLVRCETNKLARGRVPFLSNRALYMLCGTPEIALPDRTDQLTPDMMTRIRETYVPDVYPAKARMEDLPMRRDVSSVTRPVSSWEGSGNQREDNREEAQEAGRKEVNTDGLLANAFELKRLLTEIGKMRQQGVSFDAILKHYQLSPGGRNNVNMQAVVEVAQELQRQEQERA